MSLVTLFDAPAGHVTLYPAWPAVVYPGVPGGTGAVQGTGGKVPGGYRGVARAA